MTPLSLAYYTWYGEKVTPCPLAIELLKRAKVERDIDLFERCIAGVKVTGLYYPTAALGILEEAIQLSDDKTLPVIEDALKLIKALFPSEVDRFLIRIGASDEIKRHVETSAVDIERVGIYVGFVGLYRTFTYLLTQPNTTDFMRNQIALTTECASVQEMAEKCMKAMWETLEGLDFSLAKLLGHG